jgi:acetate kinase
LGGVPLAAARGSVKALTMKILTLNAGSNSLKFEFVETQVSGSGFGRSILAGSYDDIGKPAAAFSLWKDKRPQHKQQLQVRDHGHAAELLFEWIDQGGAKEYGLAGLAQIDRIAHRVVHGADLFASAVKVTPEVLRQIESLEELAPLHNASALQVMRAAEAKTGKRLTAIAVFDTVFHRAIPERAAYYALPLDLAHKHKIRRYGFHGISHRYLMLRYAEILHKPAERLKLITLHLEGGSSAAAIENGRSIDTSMGFTPLEGLMMATRSGDLDPAIVTYLMKKEQLDSEGVEKFLNQRCGLLGVSGISGDTRELVRRISEPGAAFALEMFCYRVRKYVGAYLAALNGAEAVIFGGGIGENTPLARERICEGLSWCGLELDRARNEGTIDCEGTITTPRSEVQAWVIPTQEGLMLAREAAEV